MIMVDSFSFTEKVDNNYELIVFEGSDWCSNCKKFERNILNDSLVINYLEKEKIEVLKIDFPQRKKLSKEQKNSNKKYAEKYNFKGLFPTIILSRTDTILYTEISSKNMNSLAFIKQLENIQLKLK